jgi:hypothetical protein
MRSGILAVSSSSIIICSVLGARIADWQNDYSSSGFLTPDEESAGDAFANEDWGTAGLIDPFRLRRSGSRGAARSQGWTVQGGTSFLQSAKNPEDNPGDKKALIPSNEADESAKNNEASNVAPKVEETASKDGEDKTIQDVKGDVKPEDSAKKEIDDKKEEKKNDDEKKVVDDKKEDVEKPGDAGKKDEKVDEKNEEVKKVETPQSTPENPDANKVEPALVTDANAQPSAQQTGANAVAKSNVTPDTTSSDPAQLVQQQPAAVSLAYFTAATSAATCTANCKAQKDKEGKGVPAGMFTELESTKCCICYDIARVDKHLINCKAQCDKYADHNDKIVVQAEKDAYKKTCHSVCDIGQTKPVAHSASAPRSSGITFCAALTALALAVGMAYY